VSNKSYRRGIERCKGLGSVGGRVCGSTLSQAESILGVLPQGQLSLSVGFDEAERRPAKLTRRGSFALFHQKHQLLLYHARAVPRCASPSAMLFSLISPY
jgi:hypothetical protein